MLKNILLVSLGGALGSIARYSISVYIKQVPFPLATFLVNIIGCFIIGAVFAYVVRNEIINSSWHIFLTTGICGGFTTFSAFSLESFTLLQQQRVGLFFVYIFGSICLGIAATYLGFTLLK